MILDLNQMRQEKFTMKFFVALRQHGMSYFSSRSHSSDLSSSLSSMSEALIGKTVLSEKIDCIRICAVWDGSQKREKMERNT
jgi:hypothetical protein